MDIITYALCKKAIQKSIETLGDIFTLKGNVSSTSGLPSSGNNPGDIYLVGPAQDGSYDEYYWTSEGAWEVMGSTKAGFDGVITENDLYKGEDSTGTIENPAEGTILDIVKDMDSYVAGDNIDISNNIISVLGDTIKKVTTSTFNISTAAAGIYQLPQGCKINSDASYTTISTSILIVDSKSGSMVDKAWYLFDGSTGNGRRIVYGYLQGNVGSYVQTTLDQLERNTLKVNSLSSSSTIQQYPSAKCVYDNLQLKANNTTFIGTDGTTEGEKGLVPAPTSQDSNKYLKSDGTWATVSGSGTTDYSELSNKPSINNVTLTGNKTSADLGLDMVILSYGNSTWQDFLNAYRRNAVVYCRASSGSDPATGSQTRLAFMAYVNNATTPTEVEFQYYRSVSTKSASNQGDQVFVYKLTSTGEWTVQTRNAYTKIETGTNMTSSYSNGVLTLNATGEGSAYTAGDYIDITNNEISVEGIVPSEDTKTSLPLTVGQYYYTSDNEGNEVQLITEENSGYYKITNDTNEEKDYVLQFSAAVDGNNYQFVAFAMDSNNERIYDDLYYNPIRLVNETENIQYFKNIVFGVTLKPNNSFIISCQHINNYAPNAYLYTLSNSEALISPGHYDIVASVGYQISYNSSEGWNYFVFQNTGAAGVFGFKIKSYCSDSQMYATTNENEIVTLSSSSGIDWTEDPRMVGVYLNKGDKFFVNSYVGEWNPYTPEITAYSVNTTILDNYVTFADTLLEQMEN